MRGEIEKWVETCQEIKYLTFCCGIEILFTLLYHTQVNLVEKYNMILKLFIENRMKFGVISGCLYIMLSAMRTNIPYRVVFWEKASAFIC
ncbi:hypothetical protein PR048_020981 [Dryococelus australis]|uniref:Uncharacterized protein n=1 Tax=Dryococelus australis TaxID=614101 RepID=A0ABQ9GWY1_9NEOP|nr:hypothetical protein PR048_020981 [Dryococelus australis]